MLNDPFELVYQKAYHHIQADISREVNGKCADPCMADTSVKEVYTVPEPVKTGTSLQDIGRTASDNSKRKPINSNDTIQILEHLNGNIGDFSTNDSLICIEDITDPTGYMFLSLSDTSNTSKQPSAIERRKESNNLNVTEGTNVYQLPKNSSGTSHAKWMENGQNTDENILFPDKRSSSCEEYKGEQIFSSTSHLDSKAERDILLPSQESDSHTDEELKAIVATRISVCIQNALGQSKICTKENHNSGSCVTTATPDKNIAGPHTYSFPFTTPVMKKTGLPAPVNCDTGASLETLQKVCLQGNAKSLNTGLASGLKTPLSQLKISTHRRSNSSTASVNSHEELNKGFCISSDLLRDRSFSYVQGISVNGVVQHTSVSGSEEKFSSLKFDNGSLEVKEKDTLTSSHNELCCFHSHEQRNITANGGDIKTIMETDCVFDGQMLRTVGNDMLLMEESDQRKQKYIINNQVNGNCLDLHRSNPICSPSDINGKILVKCIPVLHKCPINLSLLQNCTLE
jgi:hypothetical protein